MLHRSSSTESLSPFVAAANGRMMLVAGMHKSFESSSARTVQQEAIIVLSPCDNKRGSESMSRIPLGKSAFAAVAVLFSVILASCHQAKQEVTVGIQTSPAMALIMVAKDGGFFEREGIDVRIKEFTAGKFALQAFLGGSLDFAVAGDVPVTLASLQGNQFCVLTQVVARTTNEVRVVARRDELSSDPATYFKRKRRKLATSFGGGPEFFTYNFLNRFGIDVRDVEIVSQKPEDMPAALISGSVDAISIFDPFAYFAEKQMGQRAVTFSDPSIYSELYLLTSMKKSLEQRPEIALKILRALVGAESFIRENPNASKAIVARYTKLDSETLDAIWTNFVFAPALTKQLLTDFEQETAWARLKGIAPNGEVPNFQSIVHADPLRKVSPTSVEF